MPNEISKKYGQNEFIFSLPAERNAFLTFTERLANIADEWAISESNRIPILIAAEEIFSNVASYGYPNGGGFVNVTIEFNRFERMMTLTFSDSGIPFNPLAIAEPDVKAPLSERKIGGLGIFMVRKLMDSVEYRRENDHNVLVMKKRL